MRQWFITCAQGASLQHFIVKAETEKEANDKVMKKYGTNYGVAIDITDNDCFHVATTDCWPG